jgi:hypothetical protein
MKKFLGNVIEHNASREANLENARSANRKAIHEDYKVMRHGIIKMASWFASDLKVDEILPIRPGNYGEGNTSAIKGTTPFYDYIYQVDDQTFEPGEYWFIIARALGVSLVHPKPMDFMDFMELMEFNGNFKYRMAGDFHKNSQLSFTFGEHTVEMMRIENV